MNLSQGLVFSETSLTIFAMADRGSLPLPCPNPSTFFWLKVAPKWVMKSMDTQDWEQVTSSITFDIFPKVFLMGGFFGHSSSIF